MKIPDWLPCYGDRSYRGSCPQEGAEQVTFFNRLRKEHPDTWGRLAIHPKNEGKRRGGQFQQLARDKAMGLSPGASDIIIPGSPAFIVEMKRRDHTQSTWQPGQLARSEEHTSELQSRPQLVCRLLLENKKEKVCPRPANEMSMGIRYCRSYTS